MANVVSETKEINIEAATIKWGKPHCRKIKTIADVTGSLDGLYFDLNWFNPNLEETLGYVYINTDPVLAGKTGIAMTVASDDTANAVALALKAAIEGSVYADFFKVEILLDEVTITNRFMGEVTPELDSGLSGFTFTELQKGLGIDLGATADAIELSLETSVVEIKANQTGELVLDEINQGSKASLTANLIEISKAKFDLLIGYVTGSIVEPAGGTSLSGFGESRLFKSLFDLGGMLVLHPVRKDADDYSSDVVFWKSAPKVQSLNFDGTAPQQMAVEFMAYLDKTKNKNINLFAKGDWTQTGLDA